MNPRSVACLAACVLLSVAVGGCESGGSSTSTSVGMYYGVGYHDPWYYGPGYYPPPVVVARPPGSARPPVNAGPRPTPLPSRPAGARPMPRGRR